MRIKGIRAKHKTPGVCRPALQGRYLPPLPLTLRPRRDRVSRRCALVGLQTVAASTAKANHGAEITSPSAGRKAGARSRAEAHRSLSSRRTCRESHSDDRCLKRRVGSAEQDRKGMGTTLANAGAGRPMPSLRVSPPSNNSSRISKRRARKLNAREAETI